MKYYDIYFYVVQNKWLFSNLSFICNRMNVLFNNTILLGMLSLFEISVNKIIHDNKSIKGILISSRNKMIKVKLKKKTNQKYSIKTLKKSSNQIIIHKFNNLFRLIFSNYN